MHRVSICYGHPADPAAFDRYYDDVHAPLALKIPGLAGFTTGKCAALTPDQPAPYYLVANLIFEDATDLEAALASTEMATASADTANFADGGMTLYRTEEVEYG